VAAAPRYLALHPHIGKPEDLVKHQIIAMSHFGIDSWSFPPLPKSSVPRVIHFTPRLEINSVRGARASAIEGRGVTRLFSYQVAEHVREGELEIVLADYEHPPIPVHLFLPHNRISVPKVRVFIDFAVPRLRGHFGRLAKNLSDRGPSNRSRRGSQSAE
jgi:DNA-binding transcriptional LysR family regulator